MYIDTLTCTSVIKMIYFDFSILFHMKYEDFSKALKQKLKHLKIYARENFSST